MKVALLITTYNRPDALEAVLYSILRQTILPDEIIVADDGSDYRTSNVITTFSKNFGIEVKHSWHEDVGFRAAESRNKALSQVKAEYVIIIDGDMILEKHFVEDHLSHAKEGYFLQGGRVMLTKSRTDKILMNPTKKYCFTIFAKGIESRIEKRLTAFRSTFLAKKCIKDLNNKGKVRSCNMSFYYKDILAINGFNNKFVGWGREDSEFIERLFNVGIKGSLLKFVALGYHLYHKEESRSALLENDLLLKSTVINKLIRCDDGLSKFFP